MFSKKSIIIALLIICLFASSTVSAVDFNATDEDVSSFEDINCTDVGMPNSSQYDLESSEEIIYFDASATSNGDGSESNPFKYVNSNTLKVSGDDLTAYFADGVYDLNTNFIVSSSSIKLIGSENTIFNSVLSNKYDFEISQNSNLELTNLTFNHANIINRGTLKANNIIFKDCESFTTDSNQYPKSYGGAIVSESIGNSPSFVYLDNCIFNNSFAFNGGAIALKNSNLVIENSRFSNSKAKRLGGAIYAINSNVNIDKSCFFMNNASYGGVIYSESSIVEFKNSNVNESWSYSFGGAIASKYSDITIDNCYFVNFTAETDAGGAAYNFKGNLNIKNSSFVDGCAEFGGVFSNLHANLTILSSRFIDVGTNHQGGVIHNIYGKIYVNGSYFKDNYAFEGGSIFTIMTDSLIYTNNIFLNCTDGDSRVIFTDGDRDKVVDRGNHYENIYHVYLYYDGYIEDEKFTLKSNVLNYILSNDGIFLDNYDNIESGVTYSEFLSLNIWDVDYPNNSTIFINSSACDNYNVRFNASRQIFFSDNPEHLNFYYCDGDGNLLYQKDLSIDYRFNFGGGFSILPHDLITLSANTYSFGSAINPASLLDSVCSELTYIPSAYDSRDYGYVTPVKDQADGGNCWAFSGLATLETCIKKITNITYDFSEENAKNLMAMYSVLGLDLNPNNGGYDSMIMGYLTSWAGPISEERDKYDDLSSISGVYHSRFNIQNIKFLPARKNSLDNDLYKRAIMDYGAISVIFSWLDSGYHAVSIVGWDDNYKGYDSLGTYTKGAWIFKNSWGPDWGDNGFGHLSYYTPFASDINSFCNAYTFMFNKNDVYVFNYQYDFSGVSDYICYEGPVYYANKFKTSDMGYEWLESFATYFKYPTNYVVSVYKGGNLVLSQRGYSDAGYYTIPFNEKIRLDNNEEFIIMVENCNEGWNFVPVCQADELSISTLEPDISAISYDGLNWYDLYELEDYADFLYRGVTDDTHQVACIKAFTSRNNLYYSTYFEDISKFDNIDVNKEVSIKIIFEETSYNLDLFDMIDQSLVNININGKEYYAKVHNNAACLNISFDKPGRYVLTAYYKNSLYQTPIVGFNFTVGKIGTLSASSISKEYGGGEKLTVTIRDNNGKLVADSYVDFILNGKSTTVKTNSKGQASIPVSLAPKTYSVTIKFTDNGNYYGSSKTVKVIVKKATLKLNAAKKTFKVKDKAKKYKITLKNNAGKVMKNIKISLKVNGKIFSAKTNAKGQATFKLTNLKKKGKFAAIIKYSGSKYYNSVSKKVYIVVK